MSNSKQLTGQLFLLLFLLIVTRNNPLYSQCNPNLNIQPAFSCFDVQTGTIGFACDMDGLCINSGVVPPVNPPIAFCSANSVINNPIWLAFIADSSGVLDIDILPSGCSGGIQWALYDQCGNYFNSVACQSNPVLPADTPFNIFAIVTQGTLYYLVIDGANGASCDYEFSVNSGIAPVEVTLGNSTSLTGDTSICPTTQSSFSFSGFQYASKYEWSLDGVLLASTGTPEILFTVPALATGSHELCVRGTNSCDPEGLQLCWDLTVTSDQTLTKNETVCPGDSFLFQGVNYAAGNYSINYEGLNTCIALVNLIVEESDVPEDTTYNLIICNDLNTFEYQGTLYQVDSLYENVAYVNRDGCSFEGNLLIHQLDTSVYKITSDINELPCNSPFSASLTLSGPLLPDAVSYTVKWYDQEGQELGQGAGLDVNQPGEYYAILNQLYRFDEPFDDSEFYNCETRINYTIGNLTEIVTDPVLAPGLQTPETGEYELKITNPENYPAGTDFIWIVPSGITYSEINEEISLYLPVEGTYNICVYAQDDCSNSDTSCFDVVVDETLGSNVTQNNPSIRLRQNPVGDYLFMDFNNTNRDQINFRVLDINGFALRNETVIPDGSAIKLGVHELKAGVYVYQLKDKNGIIKTGKFVKL